MAQESQPQGSPFGLDHQGLQGPPTPLPPSWFARVGRGGEQSWPAVTNKKQDAFFPSSTSPKLVGHETEGLALVCRAG